MKKRKPLTEIAEAQEVLARTMDQVLSGEITPKQGNEIARKYRKKGRELAKLFDATFSKAKAKRPAQG